MPVADSTMDPAWGSDSNAAALEPVLMERALDKIDLLHRLAVLLKDDPVDAADLVMETYVWVSQNLESYRPREMTLRAWLLRTLVRIAGVRGPGGRLAGSADPRLKSAFDQMLPVHRTLLLLWSVGRLSYHEMASVLNLILTRSCATCTTRGRSSAGSSPASAPAGCAASWSSSAPGCLLV